MLQAVDAEIVHGNDIGRGRSSAAAGEVTGNDADESWVTVSNNLVETPLAS